MKFTLERHHENHTAERSYPYIGECVGRLSCVVTTVLFVSPNKGVLIENDKHFEKGTFKDDWLEDLFTPIAGTLKFEL